MVNKNDIEDILRSIQKAALAKDLEMSLHALLEAESENILPDDIRHALVNGILLENYPEHKRGSCCLVYGIAKSGRNVHIVCTSQRQPLLVITVYEPRLPKWSSPTQRSKP
jgi:hypothetical protein